MEWRTEWDEISKRYVTLVDAEIEIIKDSWNNEGNKPSEETMITLKTIRKLIDKVSNEKAQFKTRYHEATGAWWMMA